MTSIVVPPPNDCGLLLESLQDSPKFRSQLADEESQIELLEQKIERVVKNCGIMVDMGKTYVQHQTLFANSLWDLSACFSNDSEANSKLNRIIQTLLEMAKFQTILLDQASRSILKNLSNFIKDEIKNVWDSRQHFDKISGELDVALARHSQVPKSKTVEMEQANGILQATSKCFRHTVLDHVYHIKMLQARKKQVVLETLLSYMQANSTYFHQGTDLCEGLQTFLRNLDSEVVQLEHDSVRLEKALANRHSLVDEIYNLENGQPMQGYLFKRTTNAFKTWHRRWFLLKDNRLVYRKRTGEDNFTVMEEDLRLCTVRPAVDYERRFCFEVLSPSRSHMLQADTEESYAKWIESLQHGIGVALGMRKHSACYNEGVGGVSNNSHLDKSNNNKKTKVWEQLAKIPGNDACCDCKSPDPKWASINLGITLCIDCSGVHRSLGVHYSKVRSLTLDDWEPEILKVMAELGNKVVNTVYEANVSSRLMPAPKCSASTRETYIKKKWVQKEFVAPLSVSPLRPKRKWSVRKFRRRAQSAENGRRSRQKEHDDSTKQKDTLPESPAEDDDATGRGSAGGSSDEVAVVGDDLVEACETSVVELSSGDDSTEGEDNTVSQEDMSNLCPTRLLYRASAAHNIPVMCQALALGADKLWVNRDDNHMTHMHQAIASGSVMACEYLFLNGVPINSQDALGKTPLRLATELGHTAQVCLLLKHKANQYLKDNEGVEPLDVAVSMVNADIVTLLRLGRLNEEMKDLDSSTGCDDTFSDVVRDFSQLEFSSNTTAGN